MNINAILISQSIAFFMFVFFCMKFVWPPITTALQERQKKISEGLLAAAQAERDLLLAKEKAKEKIREAKTQASEIIDLAKKRATQIIEKAKKEAILNSENLRSQAQLDIEQQVNTARDTLKEQLGDLIIKGAEKVLVSQIDQSVHRSLVDKLVSEI